MRSKSDGIFASSKLNGWLFLPVRNMCPVPPFSTRSTPISHALFCCCLPITFPLRSNFLREDGFFFFFVVVGAWREIIARKIRLPVTRKVANVVRWKYFQFRYARSSFHTLLFRLFVRRSLHGIPLLSGNIRLNFSFPCDRSISTLSARHTI